MADPVTIAKVAATLLSNEKARKGIGWAIVAILSPIIVVLALLCALGSGAVSHNISAAQLCFQDGPLPADTPAVYRVCIEQMRAHFAELDEAIADINAMVEDEDAGSLDPIRVKAVFFSLYFGGDAPLTSQFAHCFAASEIRTRTVTTTDEDGNEIDILDTIAAADNVEGSAILRAMLQQFIGSLDEINQKIIAGKIDGLTERELASIIGISNVAVHNRIAKMQKALKEML